jgi:hypothetical protein
LNLDELGEKPMPSFVTPCACKRPAGSRDAPNKPLLRQQPHGTTDLLLRLVQRVGYSIDREWTMFGKQFKDC